jgi:DNA-binding NarL/FixJ family response regulator
MSQAHDRTTPRSIRVLLAEDDYLYAQALEIALGNDERITIVGHAADGVEAFLLCETLEPDVVVMDLYMPRMSGAEATRWIRQSLPRTKVVALSSAHDPEHLQTLRDAGADALVPKDSISSDLRDLVHTIVRTAVLVRPSPAIARPSAATTDVDGPLQPVPTPA